MATVTLRVEDDTDEGIVVYLESDPPLPLNGDKPNVDDPTFTPAMAAAYLAVQYIGEMGKGDMTTITAQTLTEGRAKVEGRRRG